MLNKIGCLGVALALVAVSHAQIVEYTAPAGSFNATTVAANASASALNDTGSGATLQPGAAFPNTVFLEQGTVAPDAAAAVASQQYFQFGVTPNSGFSFNFTNLSFDVAKGGSSSPRGWVLRSSLDGFSANLGTADIPTAQPNTTAFSVALTGSMFQNVIAETIFRLYGYAPGGVGTGSFYDNIRLDGTVNSSTTLVSYLAPGGSFAPVVSSHVTASDLNDTGSGADLQPGAAFPNTVFLQQGTVAPDAAAAVASQQYFQFSVDPESGFELDLTNLTFDAAKGGSSSPRGWVLRSSLDGFGLNIATADIPTAQPNLTSFNVDLSGAMFQNLTSSVTFRIYGYAPGGVGTGSFYDNILLHGTVQAVPEPATMVALGLGVLGVIRRRRSRKA